MRILFTLATLTMSAPLLAQANACPGGQPATVRVSRIIPTGSMAGFSEAARDHAAWYKSHGIATTQFVAPVLAYNPSTKSLMQSKTDVMTVRVGAPDSTEKHDAAWAAFVAKYRSNSTIVSETRACFPKPMP